MSRSTPQDLRAVHPDIERIERRLGALAEIGSTFDGGCCRLAFTEEDRRGRDLVAGWMREAGLEVLVDGIGNMFGMMPGRDTEAPVMMGSHIDTVATGGKFDGNLGVVAGLEVVQRLAEAGIRPSRPLAVAAFSNEEGVRYQPDMMGSLVHVGALPLDEALAAIDREGVTLGTALDAIGYRGRTPIGAIRPHAFVELHIEQGPVLDRAGEVLGVVEDLQGISWQELTIRGTSNHAGTTPMKMRHDAAHAAAEVTTFARRLAVELGHGQVATVGSIRLRPDLVNVIAGEATVTVDLRNASNDVLGDAERQLTDFLAELADREGVSIERRQLVRTHPVVFSPHVAGVIREAARRRGLSARSMTSGAGHDAQMIAAIAPTAMIFIPSRDGISHNPREHSEREHVAIGTQVLLDTVIALAEDHGGVPG